MNKSDTPSIVNHLSESVVQAAQIEPQLFEKYSVKRGLRNADHTGVLVGLTNVVESMFKRLFRAPSIKSDMDTTK